VPQRPLPSLLRHLRRALAAPSATVPDAALLERFLSENDEAAFELLVRRHERMVLGVCRRVLGHVQDAEDAFQATFLTLARKASSVRKREALSSWLYQVAFRIALRARARKSTRACHQRPFGNSLVSLAHSEPSFPRDGSALREVLDEAIHRLPAKYRAAIVLCYLEGKTNEQAALQLGCPTGTVVTHLARARRRLRNDLMRQGVNFSAVLLPTALASSSASPAVPIGLIDSTLRAAIIFARQRTDVASLVSANVALLTKGALRAMFMSKLKIVAAVLLSLGVIGAGSGVWTYRTWGVQGAEAALDRPLRETEPPAEGKAPDGQKTKPGRAEVQRDKRHQVVKEVITKSFKTGRAPRLVLELFNGGINLVADTEGRVDIRVTKQGSGESEEAAQAALKNIDVEMAQEGESIRITAKRLEEARRTNSGASAEVRVPSGAVVELHTSNGEVSLRGGSGKADVQTSNGRIEVKKRTGPSHLRTSNGPITVAGGTGAMDLKTSNGAITVEADRAELTAHTSNGSVHFQGTLARGEHSLHTSNGNIDLTVPADAQFRFDAQTSQGHIANAFSKERSPGTAKNHLAGTVGQNPSTFIQLRTSNGNIALRRQESALEKQ
jgi:RNA polymerase sigma factor (sigma-70 family)